MHSATWLERDHPVRAFQRNGTILLMARPPLLTRPHEEGTTARLQHLHSSPARAQKKTLWHYPAGVRLKSKLYQGWLASLAHPWLTCLHASGVQSAARRAVGRLAPGGAKRHPGFESAMMIAPRQGCEDPLAGHPEFLELRSSEGCFYAAFLCGFVPLCL